MTPSTPRLVAGISVVILAMVACELMARVSPDRLVAVTLWGLALLTAIGVVSQRQDVTMTGVEGWTQRASGPFTYPNAWAAALIVASPPIIALASVGSRARRAGAAISTTGVTLAVMQSGSRAGTLVGFIVLIGLLIMIKPGRPVLLIGVGGAGILSPAVVNLHGLALRMSSLISPGVEQQLGHASLAHRADLTAVTWATITAHPLLGSGFGGVAANATGIRPGAATSPHNTWLGTWAEQGLLGVCSLGMVAGVALVAVRRLMANASSDMDSAWAHGLALGLLAWLLLAFTLDLGTDKFGWLILGLTVGSSRASNKVRLPSVVARFSR